MAWWGFSRSHQASPVRLLGSWSPKTPWRFRSEVSWDESWWSGGNCIFNSGASSTQWWFQSEYIWVTNCPDKQGIKTYKPTDSLQDWQLTTSIFLGDLRPAWPIGHKVPNSICYWWLQYSPRETWRQELLGFQGPHLIFWSQIGCRRCHPRLWWVVRHSAWKRW